MEPFTVSVLPPERLISTIKAVTTGNRVLWLGRAEPGITIALRNAGLQVVEIEPPYRLAENRTGGEAITSPLAHATFDVVVAGRYLEDQDENSLPHALLEVARVSTDVVVVLVTGQPALSGPKRGREWWEGRLLTAGLRRHPAAMRLVTFEELEREGEDIIVVMQKIPRIALEEFPLEGLRAERDLHMDMLRETGRRADAHLARYDLAARYIRPGDRVVDAACGLGYGSAMLWDLSEASEVRGLDLSEHVVRYAAGLFSEGRPGLGFVCGDATELAGASDATVDCVVSFETLEHLAQPDRFIDSVARALKPGGRLICSIPNEWVDETGKDPNPFHLHVFNLDRLVATCARRLLVEEIYMQSAGGINHRFRVERTLRKIPWPSTPATPAPPDAEWWIVVAMVDPVGRAEVPYVETVFPAANPARPPNATAFERDYDNPWLVHSMVMGPYRARPKELLRGIAQRALKSARAGSADAGAALCVIAYQLLSDTSESESIRDVILNASQDYVARPAESAQAARWGISLQFVLALLAQQRGDATEAERLFRACSAADFMQFGPHLGTKCSEACFHAGRLALQRGDLDQAEADWKAVFPMLQRIPWHESELLLVTPERPAAFEFGDGMREIATIVDNAARCANGLRVLAHRKSHRVVTGTDWDRSFQTIQHGLLREIERRGGEIDALRSLVAHPRGEMMSLNASRDPLAAELNKAQAELATFRRLLRRNDPKTMKNVVIFGAGEGGRRVWEALCQSARANVSFFVDNDSRKQGLPFLSADVRDPNVLKEAAFDRVLVASIFTDEIIEQLMSIGVQRERIMIFDLKNGDEALGEAVAAAFPLPPLPTSTPRADATRVGIFGTGQGGIRIWEALMTLDHVEPHWFSDNDARKHGKPFLWLEVMPPAEIPQRPVDFVIIASMYREPISKQLVELGVPKERILIPSVAASVEKIREELTAALPLRKR